MASSNRHWPSMFKSKPAQWQHEMNSSLLTNGGYHRTSYAPGIGCEERTPEPKPRWNPKPEQIRILESIFNSGMVNPPRDEIKKIRAQLQEYGQVGDANVFYWFQNRKSRSKHKQRQHIQNSGKSQPKHTSSTAVKPPPPPSSITAINNNTGQSSSSSSSDKSSSFNCTFTNEKMIGTQHLHHQLPVGSSIATDHLNSPTASVNQSPLFLISSASSEFLNEPSSFLHPHYAVQQNNIGGFCFPDVSRTIAADHSTVGNCSNFLLSELMLMNSCPPKKQVGDEEKMELEGQLTNCAVPNSITQLIDDSVPTIPSPINQIIHGESKNGPTNESKTTVFINDVCFEVGCGPFNVRETFGDDVMLMQSTGQPVLTNEWGFTVQPLQSGGSYCLLMRPSSTIDLM